jgi:capsule polysaccharide export protein KpsE/RkpR
VSSQRMKTIPEHDLREIMDRPDIGEVVCANDDSAARERAVDRLRLLWEERRFLFRISVYGLAIFTLIAFLIPKRYESSAVLMPPDDQSNSGMMLAAALASKVTGSLGGIAGNMLGVKSSGDLFIGILRSRTVQDDLITKFDLRKEYGTSQWDKTRKILAARTMISEDRKSGIITITVTDNDPRRVAAVAAEYVAQLNIVVSKLSTSSAHRERVFLEERLTQVKQDLESAEKDFSQFASKNGAIDIKEQGRAMVESAAVLEGQLIAAQSELQGLKQIYSENNVRVRSLRA